MTVEQMRKDLQIMEEELENLRTKEELIKEQKLAKQKEKKRDSILDGVPKALPALTKAKRIQEKAAGVGFDWEHLDQVYKKVYEEIDELNEAIKSKQSEHIQEELGDVLFSIVNLSRHIDMNPEVALDKSIIKFIQRK